MVYYVVVQPRTEERTCIMALCYTKLWKLLIDHDMNRAALREAIGASPTTLAKMSKGEAVGASVLNAQGAKLDKQIDEHLSSLRYAERPEP